MSYRKVGGLRFWRIGRLGGSFYIARRVTAHDEAGTALTTMICALAVSVLVFSF